MIIKTANSVYQIGSKGVRRLNGKTDPTTRMGTDGEWKIVLDVSKPIVGQNLVIVWKIDNEDGMSIHRTTTTSPVVSIEDDPN